MNARKKAKFFKKKYEMLANLKVPVFRVEKYKVETIEANVSCPKYYLTDGDGLEVVMIRLNNELIDNLRGYINYKTLESESPDGKVTITASITVAKAIDL